MIKANNLDACRMFHVQLNIVNCKSHSYFHEALNGCYNLKIDLNYSVTRYFRSRMLKRFGQCIPKNGCACCSFRDQFKKSIEHYKSVGFIMGICSSKHTLL